jgi:hypothetical protein
MAGEQVFIERLFGDCARSSSAAELVECPESPSDPDALNLTLHCHNPATFEVATRIFPAGDALLWVGPKGSSWDPIEIGPEDLAELSDLLDAVLAGEVRLSLTTWLGKSRLTMISWPTGRWSVSVPFEAFFAGLLGRRETIKGAPYGGITCPARARSLSQ